MKYYSIDSTYSLEVVFGQIAQPNLSQEILLPALHTAINTHGDISLLANDAAEASLLITSSYMLERVCEVVELTPVEQLRRHVIFQPQNFWHLHLYAHCATHISQQIVVCSVDLLGLLHRPMIEPQHHVVIIPALVKLRARH